MTIPTSRYPIHKSPIFKGMLCNTKVGTKEIKGNFNIRSDLRKSKETYVLYYTCNINPYEKNIFLKNKVNKNIISKESSFDHYGFFKICEEK